MVLGANIFIVVYQQCEKVAIFVHASESGLCIPLCIYNHALSTKYIGENGKGRTPTF